MLLLLSVISCDSSGSSKDDGTESATGPADKFVNVLDLPAGDQAYTYDTIYDEFVNVEDDVVENYYLNSRRVRRICNILTNPNIGKRDKYKIYTDSDALDIMRDLCYNRVRAVTTKIANFYSTYRRVYSIVKDKINDADFREMLLSRFKSTKNDYELVLKDLFISFDSAGMSVSTLIDRIFCQTYLSISKLWATMDQVLVFL
ncbi:hypothetical protein bcCo53_001243 (plasmid) [Borrelia coriaceae]|nr:hypothetical protein [Borrelia coriaceae]UPA17074.1 hypothetical protein bcCo53_001243 [Borrelia coriaceae]